MRSRRVLLIVRDYPPINSPGAIRAARFVRHLPACGWEPIILTMKLPHNMPGTDAKGGNTVVRARGVDSKQRFAVAGRYPSILAFPDRSVTWIPDAIRRGLAMIRAQPIDALLSSSPPVSAHWIGYGLHVRTGLPWLADLRDPWNLAGNFGPILRRLDRRIERKLCGAANGIVVTTEALAVELRGTHAVRDPAKIQVVSNGFDDAEFPSEEASVAAVDTFRIVHTGTLGGGYRNPLELLRAVRLGWDAGALPSDTRIEFYGVAEEVQAPLREIAAGLGLQDNLHLWPRLPRADVLAAADTASLLVALQERPEFGRSVPSKVFEYLRCGRAVLAVAPQGSATQQLLHGMAGVLVVTENRAAAIAPLLVQAYAAWREAPQIRYERHLDHFRAECVTADLACMLDRVASGARV